MSVSTFLLAISEQLARIQQNRGLALSLEKSKSYLLFIPLAFVLLPFFTQHSLAQSNNTKRCHCPWFVNGGYPDDAPPDLRMDPYPGHPNCYEFGIGICPCAGSEDLLTEMTIDFGDEIKDCLIGENLVIHDWITLPNGGGRGGLDGGISYPFPFSPVSLPLVPPWDGSLCYNFERVLCSFKPECWGRCFPVTISFKNHRVPGDNRCDYYLVKTKVCLGTTQSSEATLQIDDSKQIISPNLISRTNGRTPVLIPQSFKKSLSEISILDNQGRVVYTVKTPSHNADIVMIPTDNFSVGVYMVIFRNNVNVLHSESIIVY